MRRSQPKLIEGTFRGHRDGYGFVQPETGPIGLRGDIFVPPDATSGAMDGDRVKVRLSYVGRDGRAEGRITQVLQRARATVVGEFRVGRQSNFVLPHDDRIPGWIEIPPGFENPFPGGWDRIGATPRPSVDAWQLEGMIVDVQILSYPERDQPAVGRVVEVLGYPDEFGVDVEIVIRKHQLPHRFPPEVLEEARRLPTTIAPAELASRADFRHLDVVTIDGETARDFDDAVYVEQLPNGNFELQVHIADVSYYVRPGSALDREAQIRGTSVYFPDRAVPMLPLELSTEICSLKPNADRLVLSVILEIDHQGDVVSQRFCRGIIRSAERLTYTAVHKVLEGDKVARERYDRLVPRLELMQELALILNRKRMRRGSIDFDLPEPLIEFDEWGEMVGISRAPRNIAHRIIEEFMLAANEAVALHLEHAGVPFLYRIHEPPDTQKVLEFDELARSFGYSLGIAPPRMKRHPIVERRREGRKIRKDLILPEGNLNVSPRHYQRLIAKLEGKPEERILHYLMLRSLKQARYSPDNAGHFALATSCYTHFTSPIRRYPDLVAHRALVATLEGKPIPELDLKELGEHCSFTERRAAEAERELVEWKKAKFMAERIGEEFDALVVHVTRFGLFVELADLFVEGLVPIDTLPGDRYDFHESSRRIVGFRKRRVFKTGDRLRVRLDRVDALAHQLQFSVVQ